MGGLWWALIGHFGLVEWYMMGYRAGLEMVQENLSKGQCYADLVVKWLGGAQIRPEVLIWRSTVIGVGGGVGDEIDGGGVGGQWGEIGEELVGELGGFVWSRQVERLGWFELKLSRNLGLGWVGKYCC